jgi:hypothetical protein
MKAKKYNQLKVAGSVAGNKRQKELMWPVFEKTRKITYLYDAEKKELIYQAKSRTLLSEALGLKRRLVPKQLGRPALDSLSRMSSYVKKNILIIC